MRRGHHPVAGRVVAITGGARGIGRATATALIGTGARVAIGDLDADFAATTAAELGGGAVGLALDVTDRESFARFLDQVEARLGPLDVLINNAGIMPIAQIEDEPDAMTDRIIAINLHGVITGSKLALKRMRPRGEGHIVNVASQAGRAGIGGLATYCASKYGVVGFSASLADELEGCGISISCVMPAVVNTELASGLPAPRVPKPVEADEVAAVIVDVLERPRLNAHVPRVAVAISAFGLLPTRPRRLIERVLGAERIALSADASARAAYERRAGAGAGAGAGTRAGAGAA